MHDFAEIMKRKINEQAVAGPSCSSFAFNFSQLRRGDSLSQSIEDEHLTDDGNSFTSEADVSQNVESVQAKRLPMTNNLQRPSLYYGMGVASRTPVHTVRFTIF